MSSLFLEGREDAIGLKNVRYALSYSFKYSQDEAHCKSVIRGHFHGVACRMYGFQGRERTGRP
jgi:hypothetical protein